MNKKRSEIRLTLMLFGVGLLLILFIVVSVILVKKKGIQSSYTTLNQAAGSRSVILAQPAPSAASPENTIIVRYIHAPVTAPAKDASSER